MRWFPGSMTGRIFLILLLGILASIALTFWLAFGERQRAIGQFRDFHVLERTEQLVLALDALPAAKRAAFLATAKRIGLQVESAPDGVPDNARRSAFAAALAERLGPDYPVMSMPASRADCPQLHDRAPMGMGLEPPRREACESITTRRILPGMLAILTSTTFTLKALSTASRTWGLLALRSTSKVYLPCAPRRVFFSVTTGRISTLNTCIITAPSLERTFPRLGGPHSPA